MEELGFFRPESDVLYCLRRLRFSVHEHGRTIEHCKLGITDWHRGLVLQLLHAGWRRNAALRLEVIVRYSPSRPDGEHERNHPRNSGRIRYNDLQRDSSRLGGGSYHGLCDVQPNRRIGADGNQHLTSIGGRGRSLHGELTGSGWRGTIHMVTLERRIALRSQPQPSGRDFRNSQFERYVDVQRAGDRFGVERTNGHCTVADYGESGINQRCQ